MSNFLLSDETCRSRKNFIQIQISGFSYHSQIIYSEFELISFHFIEFSKKNIQSFSVRRTFIISASFFCHFSHFYDFAVFSFYNAFIYSQFSKVQYQLKVTCFVSRECIHIFIHKSKAKLLALPLNILFILKNFTPVFNFIIYKCSFFFFFFYVFHSS